MTPIAQLVEPLRQQSIDAAVERMTLAFAQRLANLAAADWDLDKVAPYPDSLRTTRIAYRAAMRRRSDYESITSYDQERNRATEKAWLAIPFAERGRRPTYGYRVSNEASQAHLLDNVREAAGASFDAFVAKLEDKVGEHVAAEFDQVGTWDNSIIRVTLPDGTVERWKTMCIINFSKLGLVFNQWPTRRVK